MPFLIITACTKTDIFIYGTPNQESNSIIFGSGGCKYIGCVSASWLCLHVRQRASSSQTSFDGIIIIQNLCMGIGTMHMLFEIEGKLQVV
jgi:hypothetical protein